MNGLINVELVRAASEDVERHLHTAAVTAGRDRLARPPRRVEPQATLRRLVRRLAK